jgi:2-haloacid dehalogenase
MQEAAILDVNETLLNLTALAPAYEAIGLTAQDQKTWFVRTQRDGFAFCASGDWRSFRDIGVANLRAMVPGLPQASAEQVLDAFADCPLHVDVPAGIAALHERGVAVATLTVGSSAVVAHVFARAGIGHVAHLSCDAVQRWKPAPEPYRYACDHLGVSNAVMIAAHQWDLHGAAQVGLGTAWLNRTGQAPNPLYPAPDVQGVDLPAVVAQIFGP